MKGNCAICQANTTQKCAKCSAVYYCSKEHQKAHWKIHKRTCNPFLVKEDKTLGRHLVATKDIKEGEIIYKEKPLIIGPAQITAPVCLGCYKVIDDKDSKPCEKCGWPVCSISCQDSPNHKPECDLTASRGQKIHINTFGCVHPNYQCITVIRCLYMKKNNPDVWNKLLELESHCKHRKGTEKWHNDQQHIAQFARNFFKFEEEFTEDEIMKISGVIQVNGHEVPFTEPPYVAVFNTTSMLEHNCKANCTKSFTDQGEVLIAAAVNIKAGENLSICYADPMWSTMSRLSYLKETKFFDCRCLRCTDVTELGTMFSAIRCQKQSCGGHVLPKSFIQDESNDDDEENLPDWHCNVCSAPVKGSAVQKLLIHVGKDLDAMQKGDCESCLRFLQHYGKFLHPQHYYMMDVTLALAQLIGQGTKNGLVDLSDERLAMKVETCIRVAEFLEMLVPAEVRARGMLLYELHASIAETGRRRASRTGEGPSALIYHLTEARKYLEKSIQLLKNEPSDTTEGKTAKQASANIAEMDAVLQNLYATIDSPL